MNLLDQARKIPDGVKHITEWLGAGGTVCGVDEAQKRADICNKGVDGKPCPHNVKGYAVPTAMALAIKKHLGFKNKLNLRVQGEKQLHTCQACGCVLRLLIWEKIDMVRSQMSEEERSVTPAHCWKLDQ
jgi:hypothetical protein